LEGKRLSSDTRPNGKPALIGHCVGFLSKDWPSFRNREFIILCYIKRFYLSISFVVYDCCWLGVA